jgi:hypothetical protein
MENSLLTGKHLLVILDLTLELDFLSKNFCGRVVFSKEELKTMELNSTTDVYLVGNIKLFDDYNFLESNVFIVKDYSSNYELTQYKIIELGQVPINMFNVGVYFRSWFSDSYDWFNAITSKHEFQSLTESTKGSNAFRKGIYLTPVEKTPSGDLSFNLLRCSSNLSGPTENFTYTDNLIVQSVNLIGEKFFLVKQEVNHVLAQVYENKKIFSDDKTSERKAKIKQHSDKTKDMPKTGLMAFCTFYSSYVNGKFTDDKLKKLKSAVDVGSKDFDFTYKDTSALTKLRFKLKSCVKNPSLTKSFDVILYPNSVFMMALDSNRLYTHEIVPPNLPNDLTPTRLGYVVRSSKTKAIYKDSHTYLKMSDDKLILLEKPTDEEVARLKDLYFKENTTDELIEYDGFNFSLNLGDYFQPKI